MLAFEAGMPNCDSMNFGIKVMKAVTMAHSAVYDRLTKRNVMLLRIDLWLNLNGLINCFHAFLHSALNFV